MKKTISLLLAFALGLSLAAPPRAAAEEVDEAPRVWQLSAGAADPCGDVTMEMAQERVKSEHPDAVEAFLALGADAYFAEEYDYYESPEEYMEWWELTREEFEAEMLDSYLSDFAYAAYNALLRETFEAAHPGELDAFLETGIEAYFAKNYEYDSIDRFAQDYGYTHEELVGRLVDEWLTDHVNTLYHDKTIAAFYAEFPDEAAAFNVDAYFAKEYYYYDSPEEYRENWGYSVEEFERDMILSYYETLTYARRQADVLGNEKLAIGGTPGEYGIQLDGAYLDLGGLPLIERDWCLYAPAEALRTALDIDSFPHGTDSAGLAIPHRALIEDEIPYISVRDVAAALGYDVLWDSLFETVVLIDRAAAIAALDEKFTVVNGTLTALSEPTKGAEAITGSTTIDAVLTQFSTLDGDKDYTFSLDAKIQSTQTVSAVQMTFDLSGMLDLLGDQMGDLSLQDMLELAPLLPHLNQLEVSVIFNLETGMLYLNAPILAALETGMGEDDWLSIDTGLTIDMLNIGLDLPTTVGGVLYTVMLEQFANAYPSTWNTWNSPVYLSARMAETGDSVAAFLGDDSLTAIDGGHRLSISADTVNDFFSTLLGSSSVQSILKEWVLNLDLLEDGIEAEFLLRPNLSGMLPYSLTVLTGFLDFRLEAELGIHPFASRFDFGLHMDNAMRIHVSTETEQSLAKTEQVPVAPPDGATVIDWEEIDWDSISLY